MKTMMVKKYFDNSKVTQESVNNNNELKENEKIIVIDENTGNQAIYTKKVIQTREDLIKEVIAHSKAIDDDCPNLRQWRDDKYLFYTLHPLYNNELDGVDLFPSTFSEIDSGKLYKTKVKDSDKLNSLLECDYFNNNSIISLSINYQSYDGMPVGTMIIKSDDFEITLSTYSDSKKIHGMFKFLSSTTFDDSKFEGFLSERYAYSTWCNYSQERTYYKIIDLGNKFSFKSYKSMEELEESIK